MNRNQNFQKGEKVWILRKLHLFLQYGSTKKIRENVLRAKTELLSVEIPNITDFGLGKEYTLENN